MNFIVPLVVYPYDIWFSVGESDKKFINYLGERIQDEYLVDLKEDAISVMRPTLRGRTFHHLVGGQTIIRLPKVPVTSLERGVVSHEIFHAVDYILRRINMPLTDSSCEAWAYLIGYVTEQFYLGIGVK